MISGKDIQVYSLQKGNMLESKKKMVSVRGRKFISTKTSKVVETLQKGIKIENTSSVRRAEGYP